VPVIVASTAAGLERGFVAIGGLLYGEITLLLGGSYETEIYDLGGMENILMWYI
jgi:hypothetical protein